MTCPPPIGKTQSSRRCYKFVTFLTGVTRGCHAEVAGGDYHAGMSQLWDQQHQRNRESAEPLAQRMRPTTLDAFVGQQHFIGPGKLLRRMLEADRLTSVIFYGPPGTGKTTLARIIASCTRRHYVSANAAAVGVRDVRQILDDAKRRLEVHSQRTILFLDEIHRFNRAQQDVLLGDVERGIITLIGATTENPFFAINAPLVSRSQLFGFEALTEDDIGQLLRRAVADPQRGFGHLDIDLRDEAIAHWTTACDGDARRALTALEIAVLSSSHPDGEAPESPRADQGSGSTRPIVIDLDVAQESIQRKAIVYDGSGDQHYDAASALIKSMRGSDPDAALYWLAMMLEAGDDPRFIARRVAILASEDVGNADPQAIQVASAAYQIVERIGMPEARITLAQAVTYMATAPKSNAAYVAGEQAAADVREGRTVPVPRHLRDASYRGAEQLGHGQDYQYAHKGERGYVQQDYLGVDRTYYHPTDRGYEKRIRQYLAWIKGHEPANSDHAGAGPSPEDKRRTS